MKRIELNISDDIYAKLLDKKFKYNKSFNALIKELILKDFNTDLNQNNNLNLLDDKAKNKLLHTIHIKLTESEYLALKSLAKTHGFISATKQARFMLINSLYKKKFYSPIEMSELSFMLANLNRVGRNVNELVKLIRFKKAYEFSINYDNFKSTLEELISIISKIDKELKDYGEQARKRM